jgi:RNA polymerase-binding transcription factor DksA
MVKKSKAQAQAASASKSSRRAKPAAKSSKLAATKSGKLAATQVSASKVAKPKVAKSADKKDDKKPLPLSSQTMPPLPPPEKRLTKTYLSPADLKHFEKILLQKRTEVLRDLEIMRSSFNEDSNNEEANSSYSMHMADHGTETMDKEQHFMFIQRDEKYLGYIDKALERIKNNTYGICVVSGLPIPKERLEAVPHTAVRIEYKNKGK